jgi:guanylate kinase
MSQFGLTTLAEPEASVRIWYELLRAVRPLLVVISGPSGVGKDATIQRMKERGYPCHFVVTATTRARRPNEIDGIDYHFVNEEIFANMIRQGELLEHAEVYGQLKGIPKAEVRAALKSGHDVIMRVDIQGAAKIRQIVPQAITIFLTAESEDVLVARLRERRTDDDAQLQRRIEAARAELLRCAEFKYRVVNQACSLDDTVDQVIAIMRAEKARMDWQAVVL